VVVIHIVDGCLGNTEKARSSNFLMWDDWR
jgi:hypothetical protein